MDTKNRDLLLIFNWRDINNPDAGGAEVHLHEIVSRIKRFKVIVVSSNYKDGKSLDKADSYIIKRLGNWFSYTFKAPIFALKLIRKLKKKKKIRFVIVEDYNKAPIFLPVICRLYRVPYIVIVHHLNTFTYFFELPKFQALILYILEKIAMYVYSLLNTIFIVVSNDTKKEMMKYFARHVFVIYNGNNIEKIIQNTNKENAIVFLSRLKNYKRPHHVLLAFRDIKNKISDAKLYILGNGYEKLEKLSKKLGLKDIFFLGHVSEEKKINILCKSKVVVITSMKEGWGLAVLEGNACGCVAIGYNVPGLKDSIKDGVNGFLVDNGNIKALAKRIIEVLKDEELFNRMSRQAIEYAKRFSWDRSAEEFERIIKKLIKRYI